MFKTFNEAKEHYMLHYKTILNLNHLREVNEMPDTFEVVAD